MDYQQANLRLTGRCKHSRHIGNNTYLERLCDHSIGVRLHSTHVLTFYENGAIRVNTGYWNTITTRARINEFIPSPWGVYSERGATILSNHRWTETDGKWLCTGTAEVLLNASAIILRDGSIRGGEDVEAYRQSIREADNERKRIRNRGRYWIRKAQNGEPAKGLTIPTIMAEANVAVRLAKMKIYGIDRFLLEADTTVLDERENYQLVALKGGRTDHVRALKMVCPSTQAVYLNTVPPHIWKVGQGLDWMYSTENYLERIGQQA